MILVVGGSPRSNGRSQAISSYAIEAITRLGIQMEYVNLANMILPLYNGTVEQESLPEVVHWRKLAKSADGFFIVTPEYHNGISGALKNALDYLGGSHFRRKPAAIAAMAGGGKGGINALNNLRLVLRGMYTLVLPDQVVVDKHQVDDRFQLTDPLVSQRIDQLVEELIAISSMLVSVRSKL